MTKLKQILFCALLGALPLLAAAGNDSGSTNAKTSLPQAERPIPVELRGKTIEIRAGIASAEARRMLSTVIPEAPSVDIKGMLQYDVQLVPDSAPVTIVFYFDNRDVVESVVLDAYLKEQNPPAVKLIAWLNAQGIKPIKQRRQQTIWRFGRWNIEHTDGGSGDDSAYRIELTRVKQEAR